MAMKAIAARDIIFRIQKRIIKAALVIEELEQNKTDVIINRGRKKLSIAHRIKPKITFPAGIFLSDNFVGAASLLVLHPNLNFMDSAL